MILIPRNLLFPKWCGMFIIYSPFWTGQPLDPMQFIQPRLCLHGAGGLAWKLFWLTLNCRLSHVALHKGSILFWMVVAKKQLYTSKENDLWGMPTNLEELNRQLTPDVGWTSHQFYAMLAAQSLFLKLVPPHCTCSYWLCVEAKEGYPKHWSHLCTKVSFLRSKTLENLSPEGSGLLNSTETLTPQNQCAIQWASHLLISNKRNIFFDINKCKN